MKKIHENDDMYTGSKEHYFSCGKQLSDFVSLASKYCEGTNLKILELPCGYGRVTRHLASEFNREMITVADVNKAGVDFCSEEFGTQGVYIEEPTDQFTGIPEESFDIAVMGSLITHFSESKSKELLYNFMKKLKVGGIAVITTHGERASEILMSDSRWFELTPKDRDSLKESWCENKFGFVPYAVDHTFEKKTVDIVGSQYGISITPHSWMLNLIKEFDCTLVEYTKGGWDNHQDVYIIRC